MDNIVSLYLSFVIIYLCHFYLIVHFIFKCFLLLIYLPRYDMWEKIFMFVGERHFRQWSHLLHRYCIRRLFVLITYYWVRKLNKTRYKMILTFSRISFILLYSTIWTNGSWPFEDKNQSAYSKVRIVFALSCSAVVSFLLLMRVFCIRFYARRFWSLHLKVFIWYFIWYN